MSTKKTPLSGWPISRKKAFKGLGNPTTWKKFSEAVYAEFRAKPKAIRDSIVDATIEKVKVVFRRGTGRKQEPVYAKPLKRKARKGKRQKRKKAKG